MGRAETAHAVALYWQRWAQTFDGHPFWESLPEDHQTALATATALRACGLDPHDIGDNADGAPASQSPTATAATPP